MLKCSLVLLCLFIIPCLWMHHSYNEAEQNTAVVKKNPLHAAIKEGDISQVKFLVENGAGLESRLYEDEHGASVPGYTPLMYAVALGKVEICEYLLQQGANPEEWTQSGQADLSKLSVLELSYKNPPIFELILEAHWRYGNRGKNLIKKKSTRLYDDSPESPDAAALFSSPLDKDEDIAIQQLILKSSDIHTLAGTLDLSACSMQILYMLSERGVYKACSCMLDRLALLHNLHEGIHFNSGPLAVIYLRLYMVGEADSGNAKHLLKRENVAYPLADMPSELREYWENTLREKYPVFSVCPVIE